MQSTSLPAVVAVFGRRSPLPGSQAYEQARVVGRLLAEAGYAVMTGGYSGTMAATSQGAAESGGHVIGVTSDRIEKIRLARANSWIEVEIKYESLQERILHLVTKNQGMIVLPGGIGTLSEFALAWNLIQVDELKSRPLVLLGEMWRFTLSAFVHPDYMEESDQELIRLADTPAEAVAVLSHFA